MSGHPSVALIGECMVELRELYGGGLTRGYGGDVLNTSIYLARMMKGAATVRFTTLLGEDPFSDEMIAAWREEGVRCDTVGRHEARNVGLYFVLTDASGEHTFHYWRGQSAAREIMNGQWTALRARAMDSDWIYLSGVTLAILDDGGRERLFEELSRARDRGARIVFDGNFRPILWPDAADARTWHARAWALCNLALAGVEDETRVFGDPTPEAGLERLCGYGIGEVVVKRGSQPIMLHADNETRSIYVDAAAAVVDATAAGDSFNAGYMAARLSGKPPDAAARIGAALAGEVIKHPGAVIPPDRMPNLL